ncbi:MAG: hypothetical protein WCC06_00800 [Candidatus Aminicenantales bacterium]
MQERYEAPIEFLGVLFILAVAFLLGQGQDEEKIAKALEDRLAGHLELKKKDKKDATKEVKVTLRDQISFNPQRAEVRKIQGERKQVATGFRREKC